MPEGPEVKRIVERLNRRLAGKELHAIHFKNQSYCDKQVRDQIHDLRAELSDKPKTIDKVQCKGKFIWFTLDDGEWEIWHTLGMTGSWRNSNPKKNVMLKLETDGEQMTYYKDTRRFGTFKIFHKDNSRLDKKLQTLGPDMLNDPPTFEEFLVCLRKKNHWNITKALMDQKVVCGIGNYIKAEVLYRAKVSPWRNVGDISDEELEEIYKQTKFVIQSSYDKKGATIRDYVMPDGSIGAYRFEFEVYAKKVSKHGHKVLQEDTPDKRKTWWCPDYQS